MTALAATVGTGNIVGVASAVIAGGPGAVFWMWFAAFFGMATKYAEAVLAVKYRVKMKRGNVRRADVLFGAWLEAKWLGVLFAIFGATAAFGIGNLVQSNSISGVMNSTFQIPTWITGIIITVFTALVILGGIKALAV